MRHSDQVLANDLRDAGLPHLAQRAENSEWNDYFGRHDLPQLALIEALQDEIRLANPVRRRLIENIKAGNYDGTPEEKQEWATSPEGQETLREFGAGT